MHIEINKISEIAGKEEELTAFRRRTKAAGRFETRNRDAHVQIKRKLRKIIRLPVLGQLQYTLVFLLRKQAQRKITIIELSRLIRT